MRQNVYNPIHRFFHHSDGILVAVRVTIARSKDETKEEKRARKQAVKEERHSRRANKKSTQDVFANERKQHLQDLKNTKKGVRTL